MKTLESVSEKKILIFSIFLMFFLVAGCFFVFKLIKAKGENKNAATLQEDGSFLDDKQVGGYRIEIDDASLVANEKIDLSYEYPATLQEVLIEEGLVAKAGDPIVRLNVQELILQKKQLEAILVQANSNLQKVGAGATKEDVDISRTKKTENKTSLEGGKKAMIDALRGVFTAVDDAVNGKTNQFFIEPTGGNPQLNFNPAKISLKGDIESKRRDLNKKMDSLRDDMDKLDSDSNFDDEIGDVRKKLVDTQEYFDKLAEAINSLVVGGSFDQVAIDAAKASVSAGRSALELSKDSINKAYVNLRQAQGNFSLAERELIYKESKARTEDVMIAQAKVNEIQGQIAVLDERIKKSTIVAPFEGKVTKIWYKKNELTPGHQKIVSFSSYDQELLADVSEDDIVAVSIGKRVSVKFRAVPGEEFSGSIKSIDTQEIIRDGDVYYRTYIKLDNTSLKLRTGMTANVIIKID